LNKSKYKNNKFFIKINNDIKRFYGDWGLGIGGLGVWGVGPGRQTPTPTTPPPHHPPQKKIKYIKKKI